MDEANSWGANALQEKVFARNVSSLAALVWLIWEYCITFCHEYRYIWRGSMNGSKVLFLFSRYLAICSQIANTYIVFSPLSRLPVSRNECHAWVLFLTVTACLLLAIVDVVIMLRVYALYNRNLKVAAFLAGLLLLQTLIVARYISVTLPHLPFGLNCDVLKTPPDVGYFMAAVVFSHSALLSLTIRKREGPFGHSHVVDLVVRDGAWAFVLVVSMFIVTIPYSLFSRVARPYIIFVLPITLLSITACRLIVNMQKAAQLPGHFSGEVSTGTGMAFTRHLDFVDENGDEDSSLSLGENRGRAFVSSDSSDLRRSTRRPDYSIR